MSKVNIRFIYRSQQEQETKSVKSVHKGPINLSNLYDTYVNPSYQEIDINETKNEQVQGNNRFKKQIEPTSSVQIVSKPTSPKVKNQVRSPKKATQKEFPEQLKTNKNIKKAQSLKPILNIQEINESELIPRTQKKQVVVAKVSKVSQLQVPDGQIVLKSPSFKYIPKQQGQGTTHTKKQYVRAQKAQKYLYNGIPQKSQDDFVGCFGCLGQKPKAYNVNNK